MGGSTVRVVTAESLDAGAVRSVAGGARVELDARLLARVAARRGEMVAALADPARPVYGVTTGMGRMATHRLGPEEQAAHQARLLTARAVGGPPWLPVPDVRAVLAVKLRALLAPETGASAELCRFLVDRLNDGFHPAVPRDGIGCAGEIIPLCHAFQTFVGLGTVLAGPAESVRVDRARSVQVDPPGSVELAAAEALGERGVGAYRPGVKEGVALLEGMPVATMHGVLRGGEAARAGRWLLVGAAGSIDAMGAPRGGYDARLAGGDVVLGAALAEVARLTAGGQERSGVVQAPVSVRVVPQVHAHLDRVVAELAGTVDRALEWVTDSPAYLGDGFVSTAGYHACELGLRLDAATAALVHAAEAAVQRTHRLLDERFSGLPPQLAAVPGQAGLVTVHKRAVGELHALRRLAAPATVGALDTSAGQEDLQAFATAAGEQLRAAVRRATAIAAAELLTAHQAYHLRGRPAAPAMAPLLTAVGRLVPPVTGDRPLGPDLRALIDALDTGTLPDLSDSPAVRTARQS
jgi:histidine ammonia-lyase